MGDMEEKDQSNLHFLIGLCLTGILLALVWGMTLITVAGLIDDDAGGTLQSAYVHCVDAAGDEFDQLKCAVGDVQKDQQLQSSRVDDLATSIEFNGILIGTLMAFFGSLITVVVIFFAFRTKSESLAEARLAADEIMDKKEDEFDERIARAESLLETAQNRVSEIEKKWEPIAKQIDERDSDEKAPLTEEQEDFVKVATAKPAHERTATDWRAIAFQHLQDDKYIQAAEAFAQEVSRREKTTNIAVARYNQAVSHTIAEQPSVAIEDYNVLIDWGQAYEEKDADVRKQLAMARFNRTTIFIEHLPEKQPDDALEGYDNLIKWGQAYEEKDADVRKQLAMARFNRAITFTEHLSEKQPEKAIEGYDDLIKWGQAYEEKDADVRKQLAMARFNRATIFTEHLSEKQPEKAIEGYDDLIEWGQSYEEDDTDVRKQIAMARFNRAISFTQHFPKKQPESAIEGYDDLIKWGQPYEKEGTDVRKKIAMAQLNRAVAFTEHLSEKQPEKAIEGYDTLIKWAKPFEAEDRGVREEVAFAHINRAQTYTSDFPEKQLERAIEGYEELISWGQPYETSDYPVRKQLLNAYRNLGYEYFVTCTPPQAELSMSASEKGIQLYLQQEWPEFPSSYPHLLEHKAEALFALGRKDEAIDIQEKMISEFRDHEDEDVQRAVSEAREKLAEWAEQE